MCNFHLNTLVNGFVIYWWCFLFYCPVPSIILPPPPPPHLPPLPGVPGFLLSPPFQAKDSDLALLASIPLSLLDSSLCWWISFCAPTTFPCVVPLCPSQRLKLAAAPPLPARPVPFSDTWQWKNNKGALHLRRAAIYLLSIYYWKMQANIFIFSLPLLTSSWCFCC